MQGATVYPYMPDKYSLRTFFVTAPPSDDNTGDGQPLAELADEEEKREDVVTVTGYKQKGRKPKANSKSKRRGKRKSPPVDDTAPVVAMEMMECSSGVCSGPDGENLNGDHGSMMPVLPTTPVHTPIMNIISDGGLCVCRYNICL